MEATREKKGRQGFASLSPEKRKLVASKGGKAAHATGRAHEFTSEEAREAGMKSGRSRQKNRNNL